MYRPTIQLLTMLSNSPHTYTFHIPAAIFMLLQVYN